MARQLRFHHIVSVQVGSPLITVPNDLLAPEIPRIPNRAGSVNMMLEKLGLQRNLLPCNDCPILLPDIVRNCDLHILDLKRSLDEPLIEFHGFVQQLCRKR